MRIASFNVENLFDRAKVLNTPRWADGRPALEAHRALNDLFGKARYSADDKARMLELLEGNGLLKSDEGEFLRLRKIRGALLKRPRNGPVSIVAEGRSRWVGWVELKTEPVNERATENTARVIQALAPDVLGVIEAEDRTTLRLFNQQMMPLIEAQPLEHVMLVDGNDERGIDVGLLTGAQFPIRSVRSHVYDADAEGVIFSRDCAEYEVGLPDNRSLWVLVNHFKSKGYGTQAANDARRLRQARRVREIVDAHLAAGRDLVAVIGDMNDFPESQPLRPLLGSALKDVAAFAGYKDGGRTGTHGNCTAKSKFDYILLSPTLFASVSAAGIERRGMWGGTNGTLWERFPEVEAPEHAASDHAGVWVELDLS